MSNTEKKLENGNGSGDSTCSVVERAWNTYHGLMQIDGEDDYIPAVPPVFMRGFVDGYEHAKKEIETRSTGSYFKKEGCVIRYKNACFTRSEGSVNGIEWIHREAILVAVVGDYAMIKVEGCEPHTIHTGMIVDDIS